jgi:DNA mismatch repair ATPase MutS
MTFHSILFEGIEDGLIVEVPGFFPDLNLDQLVDAITAGKEEYDLKPFFYTPLKTVDAVKYRHEILRDLEDKTVLEHVRFFAHRMHSMREHLAQADKLYYPRQKQAWFLASVEIYCDATAALARGLSLAKPESRGLLAFLKYLTDYAGSTRFTLLLEETKQLKADLSGIRYCILLKGNTIEVRKYESENDYGADVEQTFEKFRQGTANDYRVNFSSRPDMNHVEARVLDLVVKLHPEVFARLDSYCADRDNYIDETVAAFDRHVQFYLAYLEYIAPYRALGLSFCYPEVTNTDKEVHNRDGFDLALAHRLVAANSPVVCNDFHLKEKERVIIVSGPNQGGKTTFARVFGQLHYLAAIGCPVPGTEARLLLFDSLFTHFEKQEDMNNLRGRLQDDLIRIHSILNEATPGSIIIMNEIFSSTTVKDAVVLGRRIMEAIMDLDLLCVCVTFLDELAALGEKTVSMVSTVLAEDPAVRTYKIVRKPADGRAYAISIAEKYRLVYNSLRERLQS